MTRKLKWRVAFSGKAFRDGFWPRKEWGVFDSQGNLVRTFLTRAEAIAWREALEQK